MQILNIRTKGVNNLYFYCFSKPLINHLMNKATIKLAEILTKKVCEIERRK